MGPKAGHISRHRGIIRATQARRWINAIFALILAGTMAAPAYAGDILRGGATRASDAARAQALANTGQAQALKLRANAQDRLARTTQALQGMQAAQAAARSAAAAVNDVANGLVPGGLEVLTGPNAKWQGADPAVAVGNNVNIKQNDPQAVLHWKTFNVGRDTTVNFDQSKGGADAGKWIAFNKVFDPSAAPSQIRGRINAQGQVYIINQNGIVFGGSSQINTRALVASSLPINDNLIQRGLLNQQAKAPEFLFSGVQADNFDRDVDVDGNGLIEAGKDYIAYSRSGKVVVEQGASLVSRLSSEGGGGRVILAGANVENHGAISSSTGQTILAAGQQIGFGAHSTADPSLRGLDVFVGQSDLSTGRALNQGLIDAPFGSVTMAGRSVEQKGMIESVTGVALNGRVDLLASYDAVPNLEFDPALGGGQSLFLSRKTGRVLQGAGSVIRILPDARTSVTSIGSSLPLKSRVNIEAGSTYFGRGSILLAPNADVTIRSGEWAPVVSGVRRGPDFVFTGGDIYMDAGSVIDVAGSTAVFVPLSQSVVDVQLRGNELSVSPLQRDSELRGVSLTIDLRRTGTYAGRRWVGTPLGDTSGFADIIERNAAQMTTSGGSVTLQGGNAIVMRDTSLIDVSGGYTINEGGQVQTTRLISSGRILDIAAATPDQIYDGIYFGGSTSVSSKWGIASTYRHALAPVGGYIDTEYVSGADAGRLNLTSPRMVLEGQLAGATVDGPRQVRSSSLTSELARKASLNLSFKSQDAGPFVSPFPYRSPTPPHIFLGGSIRSSGISEYSVNTPVLVPLAAVERLAISQSLFTSGGFGYLFLDNPEGDMTVPEGNFLDLPAETTIVASARNVNLAGSIRSPGGRLDLVAYNLPKYETALDIKEEPDLPPPTIDPAMGTIRLGRSASIDLSGLVVDDRPLGLRSFSPFQTKGGTISLVGYNVLLDKGSRLDVSGGVAVSAKGGLVYGRGGTINIAAGQDPTYESVLGGRLDLSASLRGFSGGQGGTLSLQAPSIQVGGKTERASTTLINPFFFSQGGFTRYNLTGIGALPEVGVLDSLFDSHVTLVATRNHQGQIIDFVFNDANETARRYYGLDRENLVGLGLQDFIAAHFSSEISDLLGQVLETNDPLALNDFTYQFEIDTFNIRAVKTSDTLSFTWRDVSSQTFIPAVYIADGTQLRPVAESFTYGSRDNYRTTHDSLRIELDPERKKPMGMRYPVSLGFYAPGATHDFKIVTQGIEKGDLLIRGDIVMGRGSSVLVDPAGDIGLFGQTVSIAGSLQAPGGNIEIAGAGEFPLPRAAPSTGALTTVHIGRKANISTAGATVYAGDPRGRLFGTVLSGGTIGVSGNIVAESGAKLDVSGASGLLDFHPGRLGQQISALAKVRPGGLETVRVRADSGGGSLSLQGAQFLLSDATLLGNRGGPSAPGGSLSVSSGRFYLPGETVRGSDINLVVQSSGAVIPSRNVNLGIGQSILGENGMPMRGIGQFSLTSFTGGGFDNLDLGYAGATSGTARGGNVEFRGPIDLNAAGRLRVASGGIIRADSAVSLAARYVAVGQMFLEPQNPLDLAYVPFTQRTAQGTGPEIVTPEFGAGQLSLRAGAGLMDVGHLVTKNIGSVALTAPGGDIRGNGSLIVAGDLTMESAQVYPTTLASFNMVAHDHAGGQGSITVRRSGQTPSALTAGGTLGLFASRIHQGGVLSAPFGSITLGQSKADLVSLPVTTDLILTSGSITTVAGLDPTTGAQLLVPYGLSPDGNSLFDPRGFNITTSGLPAKSVVTSADSVTMEDGATIDVRGGGDLLAFRWIAGNGGPVDILGTPSGPWNTGGNYSAGSLVSYAGRTWSAKVSIDPSTFPGGEGPEPSVGRYWFEVPESYALVPSYSAPFAPYGAFNTGSRASGLRGDPGYVADDLVLGSRLMLDGFGSVPAGTYTLLPKRYALLPGAYLITPKGDEVFGALTLPEGASYVGGRRIDHFNPSEAISPVRTFFEVADRSVVFNRAEYQPYSVSGFLAETSRRLESSQVPRLTSDAGAVLFDGQTAMRLEGQVLAAGANATAAGARVALSTLSHLQLAGRSAAPASAGTVVLSSDLLSGWQAESLLLGGRRLEAGEASLVEVNASSVVVDNSGSSLQAADITIVSKGDITVSEGSSLQTSGTTRDSTLSFSGSGAAMRLSQNAAAGLSRTGETAQLGQTLSIGSAASLTSKSISLDSAHGLLVDPAARMQADVFTLGAGRVSLVLPDAPAFINNDPLQLVVTGNFRDQLQQSAAVVFRTYRDALDIHGSGTFGSSALSALQIDGPGLRLFSTTAQPSLLRAAAISLSNDRKVVAGTAAGSLDGKLVLEAEAMRLSGGNFRIDQASSVDLIADRGLLFDGSGELSASGDLGIRAARLATTQGANHGLNAQGSLGLIKSLVPSVLSPGLGGSLTLAGSQVDLGSDVMLPSGRLSVLARSGDISVTGSLLAEGAEVSFYDLVRFTDGGEVNLNATRGNVTIGNTGGVSVSASAQGGKAGALRIAASEGAFVADGELKGDGATGGTFSLDASSVLQDDFDTLRGILVSGGFDESISMRLRRGDLDLKGSIAVGDAWTARQFSLSLDDGNLLVSGDIDASGRTGGIIDLAATGRIVVGPGASLTAAAEQFDSAGKGGQIRLAAGSSRDGLIDGTAYLELTSGSLIDLSVAQYMPGSYRDAPKIHNALQGDTAGSVADVYFPVLGRDREIFIERLKLANPQISDWDSGFASTLALNVPGSSAFYGQFEGLLHLRAPRNTGNSDLALRPIAGRIEGVSAVLAEGYQIVDLTAAGGLITGWRSTSSGLPASGTTQRQVYDSAQSYLSTANHTAMEARILGVSDPNALGSRFVLAPGVEIINRDGDLRLGYSNAEITQRTLASDSVTSLGSLKINSADWDLSDFRFGPDSAPGVLTLRAAGNLLFNNTLTDGFRPIAATAAAGGSAQWLAELRDLVTSLPANLQTWSYRLTAGSDLNAAALARTRDLSALAAGKGSIFVGEFYNMVPNSSGAAVGNTGLTANSLLIGTSSLVRGTRFEVVRTGTGSIEVDAARDIQLRNHFASIYTAGSRIPTTQAGSIFEAGDFSLPVFYRTAAVEPAPSGGIGSIQQVYGPLFQYSLSEQKRTGQWALAGGSIALRAGADVARYVAEISPGSYQSDSSRQSVNNWLNRRGSIDGGIFGTVGPAGNTDPSASTSWWVDYSNFFQGLGALGGGHIHVMAGGSVRNVDAALPTNARMASRGSGSVALPASEGRMLELGGGDLLVRAGVDIDGGTYYIERGHAVLSAGRDVTTSAARSPSLASFVPGVDVGNPLTWLPTTLFLGKGSYDVVARRDILMGPVMNTFLMPQGFLNRQWYRTAFSTYASDSAVSVASLGGNITHRLASTRFGLNSAEPIYLSWLKTQNAYDVANQVSPVSSAHYQPWIRLSEASANLDTFSTAMTIAPPVLRSTAFAGDLNVVGDLNLAPSAAGTLELAASGSLVGLQPSGVTTGNAVGNTEIGAGRLVVYTAARINVSDAKPGVLNGIYNPVGAGIPSSYLQGFFNDTGSVTGARSAPAIKAAYHDSSLLHAASTSPVRVYTREGSIESLTLFSPKQSHIVAGRDISDVSFYLQNTRPDSVSIVSAGRDIIPSNENLASRRLASDASAGNFVIDQAQDTVVRSGTSRLSTKSLAGDISIGGGGVLQVVAGRNIDLGSGPNMLDGRGLGITSVGNARNPALGAAGADVLVATSILGAGSTAALGLDGSRLDFSEFAPAGSLAAVRKLFGVLKSSADPGPEQYLAGYRSIEKMFGATPALGNLLTRERDIRTTSGGSMSILVPGGEVAMAPEISGNPSSPPGVVTEFGGSVSILVRNDLNIGKARIFTLRGGDVTIWSSRGDIAAGSSPKTVVTAPPTRVLVDTFSASLQTDLGGLATGGGIGVLAAVQGVEPGAVTLVAPEGTVDAGDAGIRATGNISIAAAQVLNADNIAAGGTSAGVPAAPAAAAPNVAGLSSASSSTAATTAAASDVAQPSRTDTAATQEVPSSITVEVLGYGGAAEGEEDEA
jgi:filamentous hemagglutinin